MEEPSSGTITSLPLRPASNSPFGPFASSPCFLADEPRVAALLSQVFCAKLNQPGEAVEAAPRAFGLRNALLFCAKFLPVRNHGAARPASWMLDVQHSADQTAFPATRGDPPA